MTLLDGIKSEEAGMSLLDELNNAPEETGEYTESEPWRPEPGDGIEGLLVETFDFPSKFKDAKTGVFPTIPGWVLRVDGDNDLWSVVGLHGVLRAEMEKSNAQPGDRVAVLYSGEREGKEYSYHHYRVAVRHANGPTDPAPTRAKTASAPSRAVNGSTQHEENTPKAAKRKPGRVGPVDDKPPF